MITGRFCPDSPEEGYEKQQIIGLCPEEHILIFDLQRHVDTAGINTCNSSYAPWPNCGRSDRRKKLCHLPKATCIDGLGLCTPWCPWLFPGV